MEEFFMRWKLTTLIENHIDKEEKYINEHGFSILIESMDAEKPICLLLDTGQSGVFYDNAEKMGISLRDINAVVISHAHYDHAGGVEKLLKEVPVRKMYVGKNFFQEKYYKKKDGTLKNVGISFTKEKLEKHSVEVREIKEDMQSIFPGITLYRNFEHTVEYEPLNPRFLVKEINGAYVKDCFTDEVALTLDVEGGIIVITGCSHPGIMNILTTIKKRSGKKICGIIGGTHLVEADEARLRKTMSDLNDMNIKFIAVSHCTGESNLEIIKESFGEKFIFNCTGNVIRL